MRGDKTRVLFVLGQLWGWGGAERQLLHLLRRLDRERFEPALCLLNGRGAVEPERFREVVELIVLDRRPPLGLDRVALLARLARRRRVDLLAPFLSAADVFSRLAAPLVRPRPAVALFRRNLHYSTRRVPFSQEAYLSLDFLLSGLADLYVTNSEENRLYFTKRLRLSPRKTMTVYNGIDPAPFLACSNAARRAEVRLRLGLPGDAPVAAAVATLSAVKGHEVLLKAFSRVIAERPGATLLLAGDGSEKRKLARLTKKLGLAKSVRFMGRVDAVEEVYAAADVAVLASYGEGMPNALMEAMAASLPVVATGVGGIPELVADGRTGMLVPAGDSLALSTALSDIFGDPDRAGRMGRAGRKRIENHFSIEKMVRRSEEALCRAVELRGDKNGR